MKVIGLIGGMSWESSAVYYKLVNEKVKAALGGFASCRCLMYSVNFATIEQLQHQDDWDTLDELMADAARRLYKGGADIIVLCTNTMHLCSQAITDAVPIPFLHIADATAKAIQGQQLQTVGLLGTKFTMEKDFYKGLLANKYGIHTLIPTDEERAQIHRIIYEELVLGIIKDDSREIYKQIIRQLENRGAEGVVLGCTEIPLLIAASDVNIPTFDTTTIHVEQAVAWALEVEAVTQ